MPYHVMNYSHLGKQAYHLPLIWAGMWAGSTGSKLGGGQKYLQVIHPYALHVEAHPFHSESGRGWTLSASY